MSEELIGEELTEEQKIADAEMVESGMGAVYKPLLDAKRAKAKGNRRRPDRRFKINAVDDVAPLTAKDIEDPWNNKERDHEEERRLGQIILPYLQRGPSGSFPGGFKSDIDKQKLFNEVFNGRPQTTKELLKLYSFMQLMDSKSWRCSLCSSEFFRLVEDVLINEKAITERFSDTPRVSFGDELNERPAPAEETV